MKSFLITISPAAELIYDNLIEFEEYLKSIAGTRDIKREFILGTPSEIRNHKQNSFFHLVCGMVAKETCEPLEVVKCKFKIEMGFYTAFEHNGKTEFAYGETHKLTKKDFAVLTEHLIAFAGGYGVEVPTFEKYESMLAKSIGEIDFNKLY